MITLIDVIVTSFSLGNQLLYLYKNHKVSLMVSEKNIGF
jgi:hypothetical protein